MLGGRILARLGIPIRGFGWGAWGLQLHLGNGISVGICEGSGCHGCRVVFYIHVLVGFIVLWKEVVRKCEIILGHPVDIPMYLATLSSPRLPQNCQEY